MIRSLPIILLAGVLAAPVAAQDVLVPLAEQLAREEARQAAVGQSLEANRAALQRLIADLESNGLAEQWGAARFERMAQAVRAIEDQPLPEAIAALRAAQRDLDAAVPHIDHAAAQARLIEERLAGLLAAARAMQRANQQAVDRAVQREGREELEDLAQRQQSLRERAEQADENTFAAQRGAMQGQQEQLAGQARSLDQRLAERTGDNAEPGQPQPGEAEDRSGGAMDQARRAMQDAARKLGQGDRQGATQSQQRAEQALQEAARELDRQIAASQNTQRQQAATGKSPDAPPADATADGDPQRSADDGDGAQTTTGRTGDERSAADAGRAAEGAGNGGSGDGPGAGEGAGLAAGGAADWRPLADDERAAVFEAYVRELPVEYRDLLEQYYQVLSE